MSKAFAHFYAVYFHRWHKSCNTLLSYIFVCVLRKGFNKCKIFPNSICSVSPWSLNMILEYNYPLCWNISQHICVFRAKTAYDKSQGLFEMNLVPVLKLLLQMKRVQSGQNSTFSFEKFHERHVHMFSYNPSRVHVSSNRHLYFIVDSFWCSHWQRLDTGIEILSVKNKDAEVGAAGRRRKIGCETLERVREMMFKYLVVSEKSYLLFTKEFPSFLFAVRTVTFHVCCEMSQRWK